MEREKYYKKTCLDSPKADFLENHRWPEAGSQKLVQFCFNAAKAASLHSINRTMLSFSLEKKIGEYKSILLQLPKKPMYPSKDNPAQFSSPDEGKVGKARVHKETRHATISLSQLLPYRTHGWKAKILTSHRDTHSSKKMKGTDNHQRSPISEERKSRRATAQASNTCSSGSA